MGTNNFIYSIKKEFLDVFHLKCSDIPVNKEDYITSEDFSNQINEPFEIYEKYLRAIELEKRIALIRVETPTEKFPDPVDEETFRSLFPNLIVKLFFGEYDDMMKLQIEEYIQEQGLQNKRREELTAELIPDYRFCPYNCNIYDSSGDPFGEQLGGNIMDFKNLEQYFDKKLIKYLYGTQGMENFIKQYNEHFLENFEYGKSVLYAPDV